MSDSTLKKSELNKWLRLERRRLKFQRQMKDMAALQEPIEDKVSAHVRANGGEQKCVVKFDWRLFSSLTARR